jgi:hypothetical protein
MEREGPIQLHRKIISRGHEGSDILGEFEKNKELIVKAIQLNPREVKRFIKNVIWQVSYYYYY